MSGHSKWSSIKHQKGAADVKRGVVFSKLAKAITVAAKHGGDPAMNFQLRIAVDQARAANMPKDNIDRAIARASGVGGPALEEITFEAYGPAGTAFLIATATDNRNRTIGEVRALLNKYGGKLAETGSVGYLFKQLGQIAITAPDPEAAELAAIEAGADDVELIDGQVLVSTEIKTTEAVRQSLSAAGFEGIVSFGFHPTVTVPITDPVVAQKIIKLAESLDELDDVTAVHSNFDFTD